MLVVANWKLNKTIVEAADWLENLQSQISNLPHPDVEIVVCPSFVAIPELERELKKLGLPIKLGTQDVSQFEKGQYTGEVSAEMLQGLVDYVIVGHSERRRHFGETEAIVTRKIKRCQEYKLTPILCVSNFGQLKGYENAEGVVIAYEPLGAISTEGEFHPDNPDHANEVAGEIKKMVGSAIKVLYGGSVNEENAKSFMEKENVDGLLVGQASLNPHHFANIVREAAKYKTSFTTNFKKILNSKFEAPNKH